MTENEAIKEVRFNMSRIGLKESSAKRVTEAREIAIQALEEIQQYRAIGTVRQVQDFIADWRKYREFGTLKDIEKSMKNVSVLLAEHELLKLYQSIGTIEEFKALKLGRLGNKGFITIGQTIEEFKEEIRNKAIDEFMDRLEKHTQENWIDHQEYGITWSDIKIVAERLKGVQEWVR